MDQNNQFVDQSQRTRELTKARVKRYRDKKRQELQNLEPTKQLDEHVIQQKKLERKRELSRMRSKRYRAKMKKIHDTHFPGTTINMNMPLENDMEDYMRWKLIGGAKRMKKGVEPHIYDCQSDKNQIKAPRTELSQQKRQRIIKQAIADSEAKSGEEWLNESELTHTDEPSYTELIIKEEIINKELIIKEETTDPQLQETDLRFGPELVLIKEETFDTQYEECPSYVPDPLRTLIPFSEKR